MREIKFRLWDSFNNVMVYSDNHKLVIPGLAGFFDFYENLQKGGNDPKLMQHTGLKDSEGNEIYEGDIVEFFAAIIGKTREEVIFEDGAFMPFNDLTYTDGEMGYWIREETIRIIGNIFQNPKLLNEPQNANGGID